MSTVRTPTQALQHELDKESPSTSPSKRHQPRALQQTTENRLNITSLLGNTSDNNNNLTLKNKYKSPSDKFRLSPISSQLLGQNTKKSMFLNNMMHGCKKHKLESKPNTPVSSLQLKLEALSIDNVQ